MNSRHFIKAHQISHCIAFILILKCTSATSPDLQDCQYVQRDTSVYESDSIILDALRENTLKSNDACSIDNLKNIKNDIRFTYRTQKKYNELLGVVRVDFHVPNQECDYKVSLLMNSSITNDEDCKNHVFQHTQAYSGEVHTENIKVSVVFPNASYQNPDYCQSKSSHVAMWFQNVFTGCCALRFTLDGYTFHVFGNSYVTTPYKRKEVSQPKYRCQFDDWINTETTHEDLMTFKLTVSVDLDTKGMNLLLLPVNIEDKRENACILSAGQEVYRLHIDTDPNAASSPKNCSSRPVLLTNGTYIREVECVIEMTFPKDQNYCLKIEIEDDRCNKNTLWNPPPYGGTITPPCMWLQSCNRTEKTLKTTLISNESPSGNVVAVASLMTVLSSIILIIIIVALICRSRIQRRLDIPVNTTFSEFEDVTVHPENDSVETTDDEITFKPTIVKNIEKIENEPIIILYASDDNVFMNLIADFRKILSVHCACRVRDWYDPDEWDEVASVGPSIWALDLLKQNYRALWIDTPRARSVLNAQSKRKNVENSNSRKGIEEVIGDFRDVDLPVVVDIVKRNATTQEYNKHFVVRLEGTDTSKEDADPFEYLSPHARYLIPYHLTDLCTHLSRRPLNADKKRSLKIEEARLRDRLEIVSMENKFP